MPRNTTERAPETREGGFNDLLPLSPEDPSETPTSPGPVRLLSGLSESRRHDPGGLFDRLWKAHHGDVGLSEVFASVPLLSWGPGEMKPGARDIRKGVGFPRVETMTLRPVPLFKEVP